ncbi:MAG: DUF1573 domain-containing protein [Chitinophagaceae bacterium]|nr:MAG: DUF1573 domain-containing protein [Chitinophagaceae bacterium]
MKKLFFGILASVVIVACTISDKKTSATGDAAMASNPLMDSINFTTIQWLDSTFKNLGKVNEGQKVEVTFFFKNTGDKPLIITSATASCGCTVPSPPKEPIAAGQEGKITAEFNSQGRPGFNTKEIFVTANTKPSISHTLTFQVEVEKVDIKN